MLVPPLVWCLCARYCDSRGMVLVDSLDCFDLPYTVNLVGNFCLGAAPCHEAKAMITGHGCRSSAMIHCDALQLGAPPSITQEILLPKVCHLCVVLVAAAAAAYSPAHI